MTDIILVYSLYIVSVFVYIMGLSLTELLSIKKYKTDLNTIGKIFWVFVLLFIIFDYLYKLPRVILTNIQQKLLTRKFRLMREKRIKESKLKEGNKN